MHMAQPGSAVLVAEDNEDIRELVVHQLRRMGVEVLQAGNGRQAIDLALAEQPALVLMAMDMPVMSGFDAVWLAIRLHKPISPDHTTRPEAERALASGCDGLLGDHLQQCCARA
jgi:CheY-like chemotaxis protein